MESKIIRPPAMEELYQKADILSGNTVSVLIYGESGTGKNCLAQYIQTQGSPSPRPFVHVHCNAIPPDLFASELFGYFPNAFTGASNKGKAGLLEMANHGTILFDEVNELSPENQTLLLHFLQNKTITPLGSLNPKEIHARVICISGRDLRQMVQEGTFRLDLYYRICVASLFLPPLRQRKEDIPFFIQHFIRLYEVSYNCVQKSFRIPEDMMMQLTKLPWMGNIREVENFAQKICLSEDPEQVVSEYISKWKDFRLDKTELLQQSCPAIQTESIPIKPLKEALKDFEQEYIQTAIRESSTLQEAADRLGISFSSLCRKKAEYKLGRT